MNLSSLSILLLEDDPGDADLFQRQLLGQKISGWKLEHVETLKAALERLSAGGIDVVLSDLNLPDSTGFSTCSSILKQFPLIPIVVMTGLDDDQTALDAVRSGAQDYLVKGQIQGSWLVRVIRYAVERKFAQQEAARLASFPEMDPNPIIECNLQGQITYRNPASVQRFPDLETLGSRHPLLVDLAQLRGKESREIKIGSACYEQHLHWVEQAQVTRSYVLDITERKEIERMKEELVSNISHELRTPLSITKEGVSLLLDGVLGSVNDGQKEILQVAKDSLARLGRIIDGLLDIAKLKAGRIDLHWAPVEIVALVRKIAASFEVKTRSGDVKLVLKLPESPLQVYGDSDRITQVWVNLIGNALKFTSKGEIEISVEQRGAAVECRVRDTGAGIPPESLPKLFGRFQQFGRTVSGGEKGTGLGLAITRELVELHQGAISAVSQMGQGTTFLFTLPLYTLEQAFRVHLREAIDKARAGGANFSLLCASGSSQEESALKRLRETFSSSTEWRLLAAVALPTQGAAIFLMDCDAAAAQRARSRWAGLLKVSVDQIQALIFPNDFSQESEVEARLGVRSNAT